MARPAIPSALPSLSVRKVRTGDGDVDRALSAMANSLNARSGPLDGGYTTLVRLLSAPYEAKVTHGKGYEPLVTAHAPDSPALVWVTEVDGMTATVHASSACTVRVTFS